MDVTASTVAKFLNDHKNPPDALEFLCRDSHRQMVFVRWPNGSTRWETVVSLEGRGITVPDRMLLDPARPA
jgi:hypothetical protein